MTTVGGITARPAAVAMVWTSPQSRRSEPRMPLSTVVKSAVLTDRFASRRPSAARVPQFTAEVTVAAVDDPDLIPAERLRGEPSVHVEECGLKAVERGIRRGVLIHDHEQVDKAHGRPRRPGRDLDLRIARIGRLLLARRHGIAGRCRDRRGRTGAPPQARGASPAVSAGASS